MDRGYSSVVFFKIFSLPKAYERRFFTLFVEVSKVYSNKPKDNPRSRLKGCKSMYS